MVEGVETSLKFAVDFLCYGSVVEEVKTAKPTTGCPICFWTGLGWILYVPPSCPVSQPVLPNSLQPQQNQADSGTLKIQVNPTQVHEPMGHPVLMSYEILIHGEHVTHFFWTTVFIEKWLHYLCCRGTETEKLIPDAWPQSALRFAAVQIASVRRRRTTFPMRIPASRAAK